MADTTVVIETLQRVLGNGVFYTLGAIFGIHSFHFIYVSASGIKKLDAYFEDGKDYNDTWSIGANFRYFGYCQKFITGKLKVENHDMRWWMYFNALGYVTGLFILLSCAVIDFYLSFLA